MGRLRPKGGPEPPGEGARRPAPDWASLARAWVEETCSAQGVPAKVTDPGTIEKVATLLGAGREPVRPATSE
jgi:hypothetical protein